MISQTRILEWVAISFYSVKQVIYEACLRHWKDAHQIPLSMGFPRQEYWRGLPLSTPGDLPDPGIELVSLALAGRFFTTEPPGKPPKVLAGKKLHK